MSTEWVKNIPHAATCICVDCEARRSEPSESAAPTQPRLRPASESVGWMNSEGPLTVSPSFVGAAAPAETTAQKINRGLDASREVVANLNAAFAAESPAAAIQPRAETPDPKVVRRFAFTTKVSGMSHPGVIDRNGVNALLWQADAGELCLYSDYEAQAQEIAALRAQSVQALARHYGCGDHISFEDAWRWLASRVELLRVAQDLLETHKSDARTAEEAIRERVAVLSAEKAGE